MYRHTRLLLTFTLLFGLLGSAYAETKIALLPRLPEAQMKKMFEPLAQYLEQKTGDKVTLVVPADFATFKQIVTSGQVDYAFSNPLVYVQLKKDGVAGDPLVVASEKDSGTEFRGIVIARKDSPIAKLDQLKKKKLVFVDQDSAGGYIVQLLMLQKAGLKKDTDYTILPFAKKHSEVVKAVLEGKADAGGIRQGDLEKIKGIDTSKIKTIATSEPIPNWPLYPTKSAKGDPSKVRAALLALAPDNNLSLNIVGPAGLRGFVTANDQQFESMRAAGKIAGAY